MGDIKYVHVLGHVNERFMLETVRADGGVMFAYHSFEHPEDETQYDTEFLDIRTGEAFKPCDDNVVTKGKGMLKVPDGVEEYDCPEWLADEIRTFIHTYLDISELDERICTYYIMMTWLFGRQNEIPYLCFRGDYSSGKTRALKVVGHLCYHPILTSSVTTAALYYMADMYSPTLLMDEFNLKFSDIDADIVRMLNSGYSADTCAIRIVGEGTKHPETYDVFCPKIIANKMPFEDPALESRCLVIQMRPTSRDDIPASLPRAHEDEIRRLQRMLLKFRFDHYWSADWDASEKMNEPKMRKYPHRLRQIMAGFKGLFDILPDAERELDEYMEMYNKEQLRQRENSTTGMIVYALMRAIEENLGHLRTTQSTFVGQEFGLGDVWITSKRVADIYNESFNQNVSYMKVSSELRALGIVSSNQAKDPYSGKNMRRLLLENSTIADLMERYITPETREELVTVVTVVTAVTEGGVTMCNNFADKIMYTNEDNGGEGNRAPPTVTSVTSVTSVTEDSSADAEQLHDDDEWRDVEDDGCAICGSRINSKHAPWSEVHGGPLCPDCYMKRLNSYKEGLSKGGV